MNVQACSRCGYGVYPAEKISCLDQIWHKACFHCEVCKMMLSVNNFVSHQKKPYCHAHNPKNNSFTSVYHTPLNLNMRKQPEAIHGVSYLILNFQTAFNENFLVHIPIRFLSSVTRCELDHFFYIYKCKVHFHKKYYFSYHNRGVNTQDNLAWISKVLISSVISLCLPPLDK